MLTGRQREFLTRLVSMCSRATRPPHYSVLARSLRVSKWSAYDMLRTLERKGLVSRDYSRSRAGGRSSILFRPTKQGRDLVQAASRGEAEDHEWRRAKGRILSALRAMGPKGHRRLVADLIRSIPRRASPLAYCAEIAAAWLLAARDSTLLARLKRFVPAYHSRLQALDASSQNALLRFFADVVSGVHAGMAREVSAEPGS